MLKKIFFVLVLIILVMSAAACSGNEKKEPVVKDQDNSVKGSFVRKPANIPVPDHLIGLEESSARLDCVITDSANPESSIYVFQHLSIDTTNEKINMDHYFCTYDQSGWKLIDSNEKWMKEVAGLSLLSTPNGLCYYAFGGKDQDNTLYFYIYSKKPPKTINCISISLNGEKNEFMLQLDALENFEPGKTVLQPIGADQKNLFCFYRDPNSNDKYVVAFNNNGEPQLQIKIQDAANFKISPGQIICQIRNASECYLQFLDSRTGKEIGTVDMKDISTTRVGFINADADGTVYFADAMGIYSLADKSDTWEQLVDSTVTLGAPLSYLAILNKGEFLTSKYIYSFHPESPLSGQLTVYASDSHDSYPIRRRSTLDFAALKYMDSHPNIKITIHYPKNNDPATLTDRIKTLNTELLNGKGEDILLLDTLPTQSLIEKNILLNISDIAQKTELFPENITTPYKSGNAVYGIPVKYYLPILQGREKYLKNITDLNSLVEAAEKEKQVNSNSVPFFIMDAEILADYFYPICAPAWINEGELFNRELFSEYLKNIQTLSSLADNSYKRKTALNNWSFEDQLDIPYTVSGQQRPDYYMTDLSDFALFISLHGYVNYLDENSFQTYIARPGQISNVYIPHTVLSINKNSSNIDLAADFIEFMLTDPEVQASDLFDGMPITKDNLRTVLDAQSKTYGFIEDPGSNSKNIIFSSITPDDIEAIVNWCGELSAPHSQNLLLKTIIFDECTAFFSGKKSLEDTVTAVAAKVELYLKE